MTDTTSKYQASTATLTPTRLLCNMNTDWNYNQTCVNQFDSYINEMNPFDDQKYTTIMPPSPPTTTKSRTETPLTSQPKKQRKKLLEKNREAAYRCRQKKKKWVHDLEERSESAENRNKELLEQVSQLREESIYLRNLLLTHGNCDCDVLVSLLLFSLESTSGELTRTKYYSKRIYAELQSNYPIVYLF
jgi:hypothetical protein